MTILPQTKASSFQFAYLNDNLVFQYTQEGLKRITWIHNGMKYCLTRYNHHNERYETFNESDVDIIRRLTNLETCEEALNELMSKISDNAVSEMPKGMTYVEPNEDQEENDSKVPNTNQEPNTNTHNPIIDTNHTDQKKAPTKYWHIVFLIGAVVLLGTVTTILWQTARKKNSKFANGNYDK